MVVEGSIEGEPFFRREPKWSQRRKQRAALLLDHGALYIAFGYDNPSGIGGWLFVYDPATFQLRTVWSRRAKREGGRYLDVGHWPVSG